MSFLKRRMTMTCIFSENGTPMNFSGPNGDTPRKLLPILDDDEDEDGDETEEEEEDKIQLEK
jgi:hypothetical protein